MSAALHPCEPIWDDPKKKVNRVAVAWRCTVCGFYSEDAAATRAHIWRRDVNTEQVA